MIDQPVAFVTGSTRGIGEACAKNLAASGYFVILSSRKRKEEITGFEEHFGKAHFAYIPCDISEPSSREAAFCSIKEQFGRLDLMVNNAGIPCEERTDILETSAASVNNVLDTNLKGTFHMCQLAANYMIALQGANSNYSPRIINISSISAYTSSVSRGEYCISKAGISMVTALFADRLAAYGIPVFEVRPGVIETDMIAGVKEKYLKMIEEDGITPIRRLGTPQDVANCVSAAASGLLDFGTGTVLNADGGFHIRRL